jgi:hypothetical protein
MEIPVEQKLCEYNTETLIKILESLLSLTPSEILEEINSHKIEALKDHEAAHQVMQQSIKIDSALKKDPWITILQLYNNKKFNQLIAIKPDDEYYKPIHDSVIHMKHAAASRKLAHAAQLYLDELNKAGDQESARKTAFDAFNKQEKPFIVWQEKEGHEISQPPPKRWWCVAL